MNAMNMFICVLDVQKILHGLLVTQDTYLRLLIPDPTSCITYHYHISGFFVFCFFFYLHFFLSSLFLFCFCFSFCTLLEQDNHTLLESWMLFLNGDAHDTRRLQMGCYTVCLASKMLYLVFTWVYPHWTNRSIWLAFTSGWSDTNLYLCLSYLEFVW